MPHPTPPSQPALVALDWGTSSLRAWSLDSSGSVLSASTSQDGLRAVGGRAAADKTSSTQAFADALAVIYSQLGAAGVPALACGMVGAEGGWTTAGRLDLPAPAEARAFQPAAVAGASPAVSIIPGLKTAPDATGACDVIRGEETQVLGALARLGNPAEANLILPGTHTKWLQVADGKIMNFQTAMTGELHAALLEATILGDPVRRGEAGAAASPQELSAAFDSGLQHSLSHPGQPFATRVFSTRTRYLSGELEPSGVSSYLSGLLIGDETAAMLPQALAPGAPVALCADGPLGALYQRALSAQGAQMPLLEDTALDGLRAVARAWGLLPETDSTTALTVS
ncbi:2-dehydro-3-deoxygalactonokinase [Pseudarthrobacter sp. C4D7]|uniref:2-dehydro-3-deoxygalactonokinase n=1 Tax=Pseudarthrobacter sp. C4D7 TaxID=2735268 RepID=UPI0015855670|nr:2-dehydro-3-deoxygalactonokinase [Pseudarthrobacter sp. C4D7]NUT73300.1 2-dehydro-3-deoxygalactonokinase [Pseudarthrobacter sp. C4D7]